MTTSDPNPLPTFASLPEPFESYHPRRTLDQFYYSRLERTDERDNDQVASKQTKESPLGAKMIMVDQLWLGLWLSEGSNLHGYLADWNASPEERAKSKDEGGRDEKCCYYCDCFS